MIFRTFILTIILFFGFVTLVAQQYVEHRVLILGNVADVSTDSNFYVNIMELASKDSPCTILINGDLIDTKKRKLPSEEDLASVKKLLVTLSQSQNVNVLIIPGDRDWNSSGKKGWESVVKLEKYVKSLELSNVEWLVDKGCPGPDLIELNEHLIMVAINTQWWNHPYSKPDPSSAECKISTERDFLIELENLVEDTEGKNILVAGHYPLRSLGKHGGNFPVSDYIKPPLYSSLRVGFRQNVGKSTDIVNERFDGIRGRIENIILRKGSVIYAAGHERNLQVLEMGENFMINSGSPSIAEFVAHTKVNNEFVASLPGLVELLYYQNGKVDYKVHAFKNNDQFELIKEETLFYSPCDQNIGNRNFNSTFNPCEVLDSTDSISETWPDKTYMSGGNYPVKGINKFLLGSHYRSTWMQPVSTPYLDLKNTFGGLTVYEKGGGHQTTSLKIKGGNGREYAFRSVDKDPVQLLPYELQGTVIARAMQDITSMQQPYGAMAIESMLNATDILHAEPKLYVMPPSDELGPFKDKYSNLLGMLEEKPVNTKKVKKPFAGADELLQSRKMFRELYRDHDNMVDAKEYAKARMFDILVGDWGKHEDNWKWAGYKKEHGVLYRPIPRDRDYVFSRWDGFLPYMADRKWALERGENFGYKLNDIRSLTFSSQPADRRLLNELSREDWKAAAKYIQDHITDEVIEKGIKAMPEEIYALSGKEIEDKLKQRRTDLELYGNQYYEQLMIGGVEVVGSNKDEYFDVVRNNDGTVTVSMYNTSENESKGDRLYYSRVFNRKETDEIRLYGLGGNDIFSISGEAKKSIKIRVVGGPNADVITDQSVVRRGGKKTLIYEKSEKAQLQLGSEGKIIDHWDKSLYNYDRHRFGFNRYFPIAALSYNSDQGLGLTAGIKLTQKKHTKQDFSAEHTFVGTFTTEDINIVNYEGRFHHVFGKWDVQLGGLWADHNNFTNFYGIGNGTVKDDDLFDNDFYKTRFDTYNVSAGVIRDFWKKSFFSAIVNYENNSTTREDNTILGSDITSLQSDVVGLEDTNLVELVAELDLDFRDRANLPEKGVRVYLKHQSGILTSNNDADYGISQGSIEQYASTRNKNPITLALKMGGSTSYGEETIPFYKLTYLGQNNNLRGYDKNRFTGKSSVFLNSELRIQLTEFRTSIVPMKLGLKGFYDAGRVYSDYDTSEDIKYGYGFGLYLVPLTESFTINVSTAFSDEETGLILLGIGASFR